MVSTRRAVCPSCRAWGVLPAAEVTGESGAAGWRCRACNASWSELPGPLEAMKLILGGWGSTSLNSTAAHHIGREGEWVYGALTGVGDATVTLTIGGVEKTYAIGGDDKLVLAVERGVVKLGCRVRVCFGYRVVAVEAEPPAAETEDDVQNEVWIRLAHGAVRSGDEQHGRAR